MLGIIVASNFAHSFIYSWGLILLVLIPVLYLILLLVYKKYQIYRWAWGLGLLVYSFLSLLSYSLTVHYSGKFDAEYFSSLKPEVLFAKITNEPKLSAGIYRLETEVSAVYSKHAIRNSTGKLLVAIKVDSLTNKTFQYGDLLLVPSNYKEIEPSYNPSEFDYKSYLKSEQIYFQLFIEAAEVQIIVQNAGNPVLSYALHLRKRLVEKFIQYIPDSEASSLASTLILGYRADLNKDLIEAYSKTGTMHVLSVSGMHVGIVFLVLSFLLKGMNKNKKLILIRAIIIIGVIWFYSLLTGFSPSVCRSALMLSFVVLGKAIHKNQNTYNLMAISAFFLLLYDPFYLFDVGFQLSYLAVAGLVYFHPLIYNTLYIKNKIVDYIWSYSALSLAAQLATFPISVYYFHQFPMYFLLSNLLIVFPVAIIMYAGIVFLIIPFAWINELLGTFLNWLINFTNDILYKIEKLPFSAIDGLWINTFELFLITFLLILFIFWHSFQKKSVVWMGLLTVFVLATSFSVKSVQNIARHELIFYSLRKNSAIAYIYQGQSVIISDIDSLDKLLDYSIKPSILSRGIGKIHFLSLGEQFTNKNYWAGSQFMQFGNFKVLRWDNEFNNLVLSNKMDADVVLVQNLRILNLQNLKNQVNFKTLIIESNIPDYKSEKWLAEAKTLNINCIKLKNNPAHIINL